MSRYAHLYANTPHDQAAIAAAEIEAKRIECAQTLFPRMVDAAENDRRRAAVRDREDRRQAAAALSAAIARREARIVLAAKIALFFAVVVIGWLMFGRPAL